MKNIFVGNFDFHTTEDELRQLFAAYGPVDRVVIIRDRDTGRSRRFGFVEMTNAADGEKAIAELNGTRLRDYMLHINEGHHRPARVSDREEWERRRRRRR